MFGAATGSAAHARVAAGCSYGSSSLAWKMVRRYAGLRLPPALIVFHRLSVSTSFVLAALRALHVDSSGAARRDRPDGEGSKGVVLVMALRPSLPVR